MVKGTAHNGRNAGSSPAKPNFYFLFLKSVFV